MSTGGGSHWLADVARRAGLANSESLELPGGAPIADAWSRVAGHCGITLEELAHEAADGLRLPHARLDQRDPHVVRLVPEKIARRFGILPLRETDRQIVVATSDPLNDEIERAVAFAAGRMPMFEIASPQAIAAELANVYAAPAERAAVDSPARSASAEAGVMVPELGDALQLLRTTSSATADDEAAGAPVIKLTNIILRNAVLERASDIHIEPGPAHGTVRFRVDGVMRVHMRMPMAAFGRVVARVKIMAAMDIADRLRPQDGRSHFETDGRAVDLRISTVPTRDAEKCVIRLLRADGDEKLADLALGDADLRAVRALVGHRNGVVIVTGPTGSGKTTTLYAAIRELNNGENNISTVEDPIEYEIAGITQMQVETKRDFTFATALRAILRQDPDVILIGEIRDLETAQIAVQASMTGHLVLSTLHTNDAASAVSRLVDVGVERHAIAATLRGIVAQRLVRRVCPTCAVPAETPNEEEEVLAGRYGVAPVMRIVGCDACGQSGYLGRMSIVEILAITPQLQDMIAKGATALELHRAATAGGMRALRTSALERVRNGETTLQEVDRVVGETIEDTAALVPDDVSSEPPAPRTATGRGPGEDPRVLLVEDDNVCRKVARKLLFDGGLDVLEATSGEAALKLLETEGDIALTILDLGLPGMQGDEVLRLMRQSAASASVPVIVLTGSPDPDLEVRLMDEGADDYIRKPIDPKRFVTRVRAALRRAAA